MHDRDARHQVQLVDQVLIALVQVHGAGVQGRVRAMLVGRAQQLTRLADDDRVDVTGSGADVDRAVRGFPPTIVPGLPALHQFFALDHPLDRPHHIGHVSEERELLLTDRQLARRASQVRLQDVRVRRVDHRRLGRLVEQVLGMVHEVLVERIVLRHQHRERVAVPSPRAPGLLPHRSARARVAGQHGGVERADVDAELECVRRRDREQFAVRQLPLELPTILGQVAGAIRLDPRALLRVAHVATGELGQQLRGSPRPGEADRADVVLDQPRHQPRRLGERAPPCPVVLVDDRRVPEREQLLARRRGVGGDLVEREPRQAGRQLTGVPDRRARQHPPWRTAVMRDHPSQPPEHHGHVRPEHAPAHVRLVDDDEREPEEEVGPPGVVGQERQVQHVRIRHHEVRVLPDQRPLRARRVAVVDGRLHLRDREGPHRSELVPRKGFRGEEVERR